jgi:ATPase subunit of ABC transporter with duplicated ATPase domains
VQVRGKRLHHYVGSYSKFLTQREERATLAASTAASQAAEIKRLEDFVARFGAKASKAAEAQSKLKVRPCDSAGFLYKQTVCSSCLLSCTVVVMLLES